MKNKLIIMMLVLLATACQLQVNLGSSVVNVPVTKLQLGENEMKTDSKLDDIKNDQTSKFDGKVK